MDYLGCYIRIIVKACERQLSGSIQKPYEKHHIIPESWMKWFGFSKDFYNQQWNMICLSFREHFIVHKLLYKISKILFGTKHYCFLSMSSALFLMSNKTKFNINSKFYSNLRTIFCQKQCNRYISDETKTKRSNTLKQKYKMGYISPCKGRKHSDKSKKRIKEGLLNLYKSRDGVHKGKTFSAEHRIAIKKGITKKFSDPNFIHPSKNKKFSIEHRKKLSLARIGKKHTKETIDKIKKTNIETYKKLKETSTPM